MSNSGRIAVIAVIAVVAFGAAFLLTGDDGDDTAAPATDVAAGASSSTTAAGSASSAPSAAEEGDPCEAEEVVPAADAGYVLTVATEPDPPTPEGTTFEVLVEREGAPVAGATVCLSADMSEMSHEGVSEQAEELGDGRYEMAVNFGMRGGWRGSVLVVESGSGPAASMPVSFTVQ